MGPIYIHFSPTPTKLKEHLSAAVIMLSCVAFRQRENTKKMAMTFRKQEKHGDESAISESVI